MSTNETTHKALALWGMDGARHRLVAQRENRVFRVDWKGRAFVLRLHRRGYHTDAELRSELQWMGALASGGVGVPVPVASASGKFLHVVDGIQIDVLTWLQGVPLGRSGAALELEDSSGVLRNLGREMARIHALSDAWSQPPGFTRRAWDRAGLVGENPLWDRFWDNPTLADDDRALLLRVREVASKELQRLEAGLDYGLIHADLVRENVLIDNGNLQLIDFDDSGFGFRLFDLATALIKNLDEPNYPAMRIALIEGYQSVRDIDIAALDLFLLLRSATYVGWIISRMTEDGAEVRNQRFTRTTRKLAREYLAARAADLG